MLNKDNLKYHKLSAEFLKAFEKESIFNIRTERGSFDAGEKITIPVEGGYKATFKVLYKECGYDVFTELNVLLCTEVSKC